MYYSGSIRVLHAKRDSRLGRVDELVLAGLNASCGFLTRRSRGHNSFGGGAGVSGDKARIAETEGMCDDSIVEATD